MIPLSSQITYKSPTTKEIQTTTIVAILEQTHSNFTDRGDWFIRQLSETGIGHLLGVKYTLVD